METRVICIGSVLWDTIGRTPRTMALGHDVAGRITRDPGGVALNIALGLVRLGLSPDLLSAVGRDAEGEAIAALARARGIGTEMLYLSEDLPTDRYMAIEGANGLVAAIADAHSLEEAGDKILRPLIDGRLGSDERPFTGVAALDGNLSEDLLARIATGPWLGAADLRVAPASTGKALRLLPLLRHPRAVIYVNLEEAGLLLGAKVDTAPEAARALVARGASRVLVTNGPAPCAMADASGTIEARPPQVTVTRVTGAGDSFMAAHIAAELRGETGEDALRAALVAAAAHVSGETPT
ncbi:PfkB family carbohydrate kinase [Palleronia sp. LCG004]|uniref:PfkB family carbohydrate kinase n=1 Tax=Palleronia sp. LCG004 TaxID=3079304 RepID=UPI0029423DD2|nr:PfkB family carbohydrate kinase [Palleronia sp. LCG004]WOI57231.1 PfkB family carbohydrate kinase [Palleronia sp. LCG004]